MFPATHVTVHLSQLPWTSRSQNLSFQMLACVWNSSFVHTQTGHQGMDRKGGNISQPLEDRQDAKTGEKRSGFTSEEYGNEGAGSKKWWALKSQANVGGPSVLLGDSVPGPCPENPMRGSWDILGAPKGAQEVLPMLLGPSQPSETSFWILQLLLSRLWTA